MATDTELLIKELRELSVAFPRAVYALAANALEAHQKALQKIVDAEPPHDIHEIARDALAWSKDA